MHEYTARAVLTVVAAWEYEEAQVKLALFSRFGESPSILFLYEEPKLIWVQPPSRISRARARIDHVELVVHSEQFLWSSFLQDNRD